MRYFLLGGEFSSQVVALHSCKSQRVHKIDFIYCRSSRNHIAGYFYMRYLKYLAFAAHLGFSHYSIKVERAVNLHTAVFHKQIQFVEQEVNNWYSYVGYT